MDRPLHNNDAPQSGASSLHQRADRLALAGVAFAALCVGAAFGSAWLVDGAVHQLGVDGPAWLALYALVIATVAILLLPAFRGFKLAQNAKACAARQ